MRTEFGWERMSCSCKICVANCRHMPGYLIPADLDRMIPPGVDPFTWAEQNLLASPGAIIKSSRTGQLRRVPTLVLATKPDGSCINLTPDDRCSIHENAPFGCAFFDCKISRREANDLSARGVREIMAANVNSLYHRIWRRLNRLGKVSPAPEEKRKVFAQ
jgi:hypothetical protein